MNRQAYGNSDLLDAAYALDPEFHPCQSGGDWQSDQSFFDDDSVTDAVLQLAKEWAPVIYLDKPTGHVDHLSSASFVQKVSQQLAFYKLGPEGPMNGGWLSDNWRAHRIKELTPVQWWMTMGTSVTP
eukprot:gene10414-9177_t